MNYEPDISDDEAVEALRMMFEHILRGAQASGSLRELTADLVRFAEASLASVRQALAAQRN